ncbi:hypothetical protein [Actinomadura sp. 6N118]|uniref:hypothetical protein n=1 Tax=Actinomadura sp. 6N118 TaxID=3375151 RepID=UPI003791E9B2
MSTLKTTCTHHGPIAQRVQMHPTPAARVWRWFRRTGDERRPVHWPDSFEFKVPAKGDGYEFVLSVHFTWCVTGHAFGEVLVSRAQDNRTALLERVVARVRDVSRLVPPYDAGAAETRIHQTIATLFNTTQLVFVAGTEAGAPTDGDARPIDPRTVLRLDKPVRKAQQEAWTQRQRAVNTHDLSQLLAGQFSERRELWQRFLESGQGDWLTPYAVALATDPNSVAQIVERMTEDRREHAKELADHVVDQVQAYEDRDAFDLMMQNDRVLRHLMELMGVPGLPPPNPSPFDEAGGGGG